jgi:hypothetical protein
LLRKVEIERRGSQLFTTQLPSGNTADVPTLLRLHVVGRNKHPWGFGSIPIGRVQPQDVPAWINDLVIAGYKPRTVRPCYRFFSTIMRAAVAAKMIVFGSTSRWVRRIIDVCRIPEGRVGRSSNIPISAVAFVVPSRLDSDSSR